jgi:hypothetical protein
MAFKIIILQKLLFYRSITRWMYFLNVSFFYIFTIFLNCDFKRIFARNEFFLSAYIPPIYGETATMYVQD